MLMKSGLLTKIQGFIYLSSCEKTGQFHPKNGKNQWFETRFHQIWDEKVAQKKATD
jgi:hypothetical protein